MTWIDQHFLNPFYSSQSALIYILIVYYFNMSIYLKIIIMAPGRILWLIKNLEKLITITHWIDLLGALHEVFEEEIWEWVAMEGNDQTIRTGPESMFLNSFSFLTNRKIYIVIVYYFNISIYLKIIILAPGRILWLI